MDNLKRQRVMKCCARNRNRPRTDGAAYHAFKPSSRMLITILLLFCSQRFITLLVDDSVLLVFQTKCRKQLVWMSVLWERVLKMSKTERSKGRNHKDKRPAWITVSDYIFQQANGYGCRRRMMISFAINDKIKETLL